VCSCLPSSGGAGSSAVGADSDDPEHPGSRRREDHSDASRLPSLVFRELDPDAFLLVAQRDHQTEVFEARPAGLESSPRRRSYAELLDLKACGYSVIIDSPGEVPLPL